MMAERRSPGRAASAERTRGAEHVKRMSVVGANDCKDADASLSMFVVTESRADTFFNETNINSDISVSASAIRFVVIESDDRFNSLNGGVCVVGTYKCL